MADDNMGTLVLAAAGFGLGLYALGRSGSATPATTPTAIGTTPRVPTAPRSPTAPTAPGYFPSVNTPPGWEGYADPRTSVYTPGGASPDSTAGIPPQGDDWGSMFREPGGGGPGYTPPAPSGGHGGATTSPYGRSESGPGYTPPAPSGGHGGAMTSPYGRSVSIGWDVPEGPGWGIGNGAYDSSGGVLFTQMPRVPMIRRWVIDRYGRKVYGPPEIHPAYRRA